MPAANYGNARLHAAHGVTLVLEEHADALIIPEAAVTYDAQKNAFVEVLSAGAKNGRRKIAVKLGVGNGTKIQILDGLKQGDKVILPS